MKGLYVVFTLLLLPLVSAQYYADITLDVAEDGSVSIDGITNHPDLQPGVSDAFTSKNREHWLLNVTIPEQFDEVVLTVLLPPDATLNYVSAKSAVNIYSRGDRVMIKRIGSNTTISLAAQYRIERTGETIAVWTVTGLAFILVGAAALLFFRRTSVKKAEKKTQSHPTYIDGLPARQREIIALLEKSGGQLTQKQIEQGMSIPKSSVSRNLDSLYRRGLIKRESFGMTNVIILVK